MDGELMERVTALRAAIARLRTELDALAAAEEELTQKLRAMGIDDAITTVDLPTVAGLPSRRKKKDQAARDVSTLKAAAAGAGLMLGVALVVLLALNLVSRRAETPALAASTTPSAVPVVVNAPPPPPPPPRAEPPKPSAEPKPEKPEMGAITILCTPRCDAITDNGIPLSPGNLVGVPVAVGPHRIEARGNGTKRAQNVNVAAGQTKEVRINLEPVDRGF